VSRADAPGSEEVAAGVLAWAGWAETAPAHDVVCRRTAAAGQGGVPGNAAEVAAVVVQGGEDGDGPAAERMG
jgi:hypothetical protein